MFGDDLPTILKPLSQKLVLYPQGYPKTQSARKVCEELVHHCGGDSQRTFDLKRSTPEQAIDHAVRIRAFQDPGRPALCVVQATGDLEATMALRAAFEAQVPVARTAVWAIYWDPDLDREFLASAQAHGVIIGDLCEGATFRHESGLEFLVLCPFIDNSVKLAEETALMAYARRPKRQQRPSGSHPSVKVQLAS